MTNLKLTKEQIEALRALSAELADKLESGEPVTLERAVEKWEPEGGIWLAGLSGDAVIRDNIGDKSIWRSHGVMRQSSEAAERLANDQRIFNRLHAYREEFSPGYVVPPAGGIAWTPALCEDGKYRMSGSRDRIVGVIYMPHNICEAICNKLNSGEVEL